MRCLDIVCMMTGVFSVALQDVLHILLGCMLDLQYID